MSHFFQKRMDHAKQHVEFFYKVLEQNQVEIEPQLDMTMTTSPLNFQNTSYMSQNSKNKT